VSCGKREYYYGQSSRESYESESKR
jgi:hypothetical protein